MGQGTSWFDLARDGKLAEIQELLQNPEPGFVNQRDPSNEYAYTALHWAAREGRTSVVELLLQSGAEIEASTSYGYTPLHWAAKGNHVAVAQVLLDAGANVNAQDEMGDAPLHLAARLGHLDIVLLFLEKAPNLDLNLVEKWGNIALQVATSVPVARALIEAHKGRNPRLADEDDLEMQAETPRHREEIE